LHGDACIPSCRYYEPTGIETFEEVEQWLIEAEKKGKLKDDDADDSTPGDGEAEEETSG
jgi:hypothetical protein